MATPANSFQICRIKKQLHISLVRFLVMYDGRARVRPSACKIYVASPTAMEIAGEDFATQGPPLFREVVLAISVSGCSSFCHNMCDNWDLEPPHRGTAQWVSEPFIEQQKRKARIGSSIQFSNSLESLTIVSRFINPFF